MPLLTLQDAKAQMGITTTTQDALLQTYVDAATRKVEEYVGPVDPREVTERIPAPRSGTELIVLQTTPILSLTSLDQILTAGHAYAVEDLDLDPATGIVQRLDGGRLHGPLRAVYQAGRTDIPADYQLAAQLLVQHLWRTRLGPGRPGQGGADDFDVTQPTGGYGYAIPNRVLELLGPKPPQGG
jgi:hypothetical protein